MQNQPSNKLKMPDGITPLGMVQDASDVLIQTLTSLPEILLDISDSLSVIALYCEKKGLVEGIISNEELEGKDKPDNEPKPSN